MSDLNTILTLSEEEEDMECHVESESENDSDIERADTYIPACIICLVNDGNLIDVNAPIIRDNRIYIKRCRCNVLVHEECIVKWYNKSKQCVICHNRICIKKSSRYNDAIANDYATLAHHRDNNNPRQHSLVHSRPFECGRIKWQCFIFIVFLVIITYIYLTEY